MLKIANASAFWGDQPDAAATLMRQAPDIDYLTFDYLAEVSLSIMAIQRERDPTTGYAKDFVDVVRSLTPFWREGSRVKIVANAGGLNPRGCAEACRHVLDEAGCGHLRIGVVSGDDVLATLTNDARNAEFRNLETGESLESIASRLVTANAYMGAGCIAESLQGGADIVITGRVADPSLIVGPCMAHYKWSATDYSKIAGATIAGHLIECGTQVTGGISTDWLTIANPSAIGFPIAEVADDGSCVITKPAGSSGRVSERTVKEQLLYEIGDPARYLSPDVTVSFLAIEVKEAGNDRVSVKGAIGSTSPSTYKVSATYRNGFRADAMLALFGADVVEKARRCGQVIIERVRAAGFELERSLVECIGAGDVVPGVVTAPENLREVVLRVSVADNRREAVERFTKEIAPLVTSGAQGVTGYATGRPKVRPVFGYWPCLVKRDFVKATMEMQ